MDLVARGPGFALRIQLRTQLLLLLVDMLGTSGGDQPLQAGCLGNCGLPRVDSARCEPGLLLADLAGAASLLKLFA